MHTYIFHTINSTWRSLTLFDADTETNATGSDSQAVTPVSSRRSSSPVSSQRSSPSAAKQRNRLLKDLIDQRLKRISIPRKEKKEREFKYTSNKEQFIFNEGILADLESIKLEGREKRKVCAAMKKLK